MQSHIKFQFYMDYLASINPQVRALHAYTLRPERVGIKLNQNENPWDAPDSLKQEVAERLARLDWARYPDFVPVSLHEKLARHAGWRPDGVLAGNGSNELIQALLTVTMGPGKRVLLSEPTFMLYRQIAVIQGGEVVRVLLHDDFSFATGKLKQSLAAYAPAVTVLCSPNNPTGSLLSLEDLAELLEAAPGLVVVDEAYGEFAGVSAVSLLPRYPNLVVLRTFSKAMGLAAWRVGYCLASPELTQEIGKALLPYNLSLFAQTVAEVALERYDAELQPRVARIVAERGRVYAAIAALPGLQPFVSAANFLLVHCAKLPPREVYEEMLRHDILIRDVTGYPLLGEHFRVGIGTPAENDKMLAVLRSIT